MANSIRIRAKASAGEATVKALITHPMETGLRKDKKTGDKIPAHYITEVKGEHNGKTVVVAQWGPAVSKNPYIAFVFAGAKPGDSVKLSWVDNQGKSDTAEAKIK
ncbi:MAG: thiosulfate oxidation carrier complex protein SoxZ [Gammaproteobacteria bacterium]|nr:thiosulfate oxidation carrier complex protein SoxZ [Gammaproteobacteria bacterium]MDH5650347.1 thiosulfate oxidation carrier complex protein SoxZ [Gammaproteobacteria bacterium]MDH5650890.1 thiosulfate oxidation carrier complex protein SoxZ [Gammaproteobacteria bacterium]